MNSIDYQGELSSLIDLVLSENASDIHFSVGSNVILRVDGALVPLTKKPILTNEDIDSFLRILLTEEQYAKFINDREIDFSYQHSEEARFRGNGFFQRGTVAMVLRNIPNIIYTVEELNLPPTLKDFANRPQGLFLCVGPTGQGKSTTLASLIELINQTKSVHIITVEDPIEHVYKPKKSVIEQRELGSDTKDFSIALQSASRQDADVILVGEMRDHKTIATVVTAAETGHLVFSTLHTNSAVQTVDRIIDTFPAEQQQQIRLQLAASLSAIFSQRLIPRISGGLVPAYELLISNTAVRNLIREGRTHEIQTVIETSLEKGMISMNRSLIDLVQRGEITTENAFAHSIDPKGLERLM